MMLMLLLAISFVAVGYAQDESNAQSETTTGWVKFARNPVLGGDLGTCFDISVLKEEDTYRMWFSWRPKKSIALVESTDGIHWSKPEIVLGPNEQTPWENDLNRPVVIKNGDLYQMWYTGQAQGKSWLGFATSQDGKNWERMSDKPVLSAEKPWEKVAVMCPHVIFDDKDKLYRMWYSGGEQHEPNAIGYATSTDGREWTKHQDNPIFRPDPKSDWEKERVTACQVIRQGDWYIMFYIGFRDVDHAQIGIARSMDGITGWQRHSANPIIRPGKDQWDHDAVYKPYAIYDGKKWLLWYNGRKGGKEQIGVAMHEGLDLGFAGEPKTKVEFRWIEDNPIKNVTEEKGIIAWENDLMYLHKNAILTSNDVAEAILSKNDLTANGIGVVYSVKLILTQAAKQKLAMAIEKSGGKRLAVVVDGNIRGATFFKDKATIDANIPSAGFLSSKSEADRIVEATK